MRLGIIWRIMEIKGGVYQPGWITPSEISIILQMMRKPNSMMFYYSCKIIPSLKTSENMLTSIDVKFICLFIGKFRRWRVVQFCKYSPNSGCRPSSFILAVLAMFLANTSPISSLQNRWNVPPFCTHYKNNSISCPGLLWLTIQFSGNYAVELTSFVIYR